MRFILAVFLSLVFALIPGGAFALGTYFLTGSVSTTVLMSAVVTGVAWVAIMLAGLVSRLKSNRKHKKLYA